MKKIFYVFIMAILVAMTSCSPARKLEVAIAIAAKECPMEIDEMTTVIDICTEDKNVVYKCMIDEIEAGIDASDMNNEVIKPILKNSLLGGLKSSAASDDDIAELLKLCKKADYNILYRFIGSQTDYQFDVTIDADEL